jgi:sec-independent protein translocase protein TatC
MPDRRMKLSRMVLKMVLTFLAGTILAFLFRVEIATILKLPLLWAVAPPVRMQSINPIEVVSLSFRLAFLTGFLASFPLLFHFFTQFVARASEQGKKSVPLSVMGLEFALYYSGVLVCFFQILPPLIRWLHFSLIDYEALGWTMTTYYSFTTSLCVATGLIAQMPAVLMRLNAARALSARQLRERRFHLYAVMVILAGLIALTLDFYVIAIFALPMILVFEGSIWLVRWLEKRRDDQS